MGEGTFTISAVATTTSGPPPEYDLTVDSSSGVTVGDHVLAELSDGTDAVYRCSSIPDSTTVHVVDDLTEGNSSTAFGEPATGSGAFKTPTNSSATAGLTLGPEGARGWRAAIERNFNVLASIRSRLVSSAVDAFLSTDVIEAIVKRVQESGGTTLTMGAVADGQYLRRSGTSVIGAGTTVSAHVSDHVSGGSDPFTSAQVIEAVCKRLQESGASTTLTMGAVADGQALIRSGSNIVGQSAGTGVLESLHVDSGGSSVTGTTSLTNLGSSYTLPAGKLASTGDRLIMTLVGSQSGSGESGFTLGFGSADHTIHGQTSSATTWAKVVITKTGSSTQDLFRINNIDVSQSVASTGSENDANTISIQLKTQPNNTGRTVNLDLWTIDYVPAP